MILDLIKGWQFRRRHYAVILDRPLAIRLAITLRPPFVALLARMDR